MHENSITQNGNRWLRLAWRDALIQRHIAALGLKQPPKRVDPTEAQRKAVLKRDRRSCRYCRATERKLHIDHVVPVAKGGRTTVPNLVAACQRCNLRKGTKLWNPIPLSEL